MVWSFLLVLGVGCGAASGSPALRDEESSGAANRSQGLCLFIPAEGPATPGDFALEQEVTIAHAQGGGSFRAVLERRGAQITVVALGPHGGRGFVLRHAAGRVEFENHMPFELPFPPAYMLSDIYRTWFAPRRAASVAHGAAHPMPDARCDSAQAGDVVAELMYQSTQGKMTVERRFCRASDSLNSDTGSAGCEGVGITVDYASPGLDDCAPYRCAPPERTVLRNLDYGYTVTTRTLRWTSIP